MSTQRPVSQSPIFGQQSRALRYSHPYAKKTVLINVASNAAQEAWLTVELGLDHGRPIQLLEWHARRVRLLCITADRVRGYGKGRQEGNGRGGQAIGEVRSKDLETHGAQPGHT